MRKKLFNYFLNWGWIDFKRKARYALQFINKKRLLLFHMTTILARRKANIMSIVAIMDKRGQTN